jgi:hypothetical protein
MKLRAKSLDDFGLFIFAQVNYLRMEENNYAKKRKKLFS